MAIDLQNGYNELKHHIGHKIVCIGYRESPYVPPCNIALECETCNCVLLDFNDDVVNEKYAVGEFDLPEHNENP